VGMLPHRRRSPFRLSGGQMQRVAIAAMLALRPRVLVLDEPTAGLDPAGKAEVLGVIRGLREQGITIVLVEQDAEAVAEFADRVIILEDGRVTLEGPPTEVFSQPEALARAGLAAPQVSELAARLGHCGRGAPSHFVRLEEASSVLATELGTLTAGQTASRPLPRPHCGRSTTQPVIRTADLWYRYNSDIVALRGVDLEIPEGAFVAILGQNGSGKTTLVKHFNALLKPTRGQVEVCGERTAGKSVAELARSVGYVFQNPDHQLFCSSVREEVAFGLRNLGLAPAAIEARTDEALERFELTTHAEYPPALLGFGLRRKVTLAAVCAMRPRVLILDEPTTGLDWASSLHLMAYVEELHQAGHTILLITHDMRLAAAYAERVLVLQEGRVLLDGDTRWVFCQREQLRQAQLEPPQIARLAERLRALGVPLGEGILTVDDLLAALPAAARVRPPLPSQPERPLR
jgi:energy-coupling factor transporter ATP-binding protein EcfA2